MSRSRYAGAARTSFPINAQRMAAVRRPGPAEKRLCASFATPFDGDNKPAVAPFCDMENFILAHLASESAPLLRAGYSVLREKRELAELSEWGREERRRTDNACHQDNGQWWGEEGSRG